MATILKTYYNGHNINKYKQKQCHLDQCKSSDSHCRITNWNKNEPQSLDPTSIYLKDLMNMI